MLNNVTSDSGKLVATRPNGYAISEDIVQDTGEPDFVLLKDVKSVHEYDNMCTSASSIDTLISDTKLELGDKIVVIKQDGTDHRMTINSTTPITSDIIPIMTSDTEPSGIVTTSAPGSPYQAFAGSGVYFNMGSLPSWIKYQYDAGIRMKAVSYILKSVGSSPIDDWTVEGTNDDVNWETLDTRINENILSYESRSYDIISPGYYNAYKINITDGGSSILLNNTRFLNEGSEIDVSSITQGGTPLAAAKIDDKIIINSTELTPSVSNFSFSTVVFGGYQYPDLPISGRTIQTRVDFMNAGNSMTEMSFDIYT